MRISVACVFATVCVCGSRASRRVQRSVGLHGSASVGLRMGRRLCCPSRACVGDGHVADIISEACDRELTARRQTLETDWTKKMIEEERGADVSVRLCRITHSTG